MSGLGLSSPAAELALSPQSLLPGLGAEPRAHDPEAARQAAEDFEAVFLAQMLSHMFAGIRTDGPFGGGKTEEMFRSVMLDQYGRMIARSGGLGIADSVAAEILKLQEAP